MAVVAMAAVGFQLSSVKNVLIHVQLTLHAAAIRMNVLQWFNLK